MITVTSNDSTHGATGMTTKPKAHFIGVCGAGMSAAANLMLEAGYTVTTVGGGTFTAAIVDGAVVLTDAAGNTATVTTTDVEASNGLVHVIDTVLMPQ